MCRGKWAMLCRYTICCLRNLEVSKLSKNLCLLKTYAMLEEILRNIRNRIKQKLASMTAIVT